MSVKFIPTEEDLLKGEKQVKTLIDNSKQDQKWFYYILVGSFGFLIALNFILPSTYTIKKPTYDINSGFIGFILMFFAGVFWLHLAISDIDDLFKFLLFSALLIILLYFGLPLYLGFKW